MARAEGREPLLGQRCYYRLHNAEGKLVGFAKVTRDLTTRRETEEQARQLAAEQAAHAESARRSDELARLNEQLVQQAAELEVRKTELERQASALQELASRL